MAASVSRSVSSSSEPLLDVLEEDADDLRDMLLHKRVEDDDVVQPVQELRD